MAALLTKIGESVKLAPNIDVSDGLTNEAVRTVTNVVTKYIKETSYRIHPCEIWEGKLVLQLLH